MMGQSRASNGWLGFALAFGAFLLIVFFGTPIKTAVRGVFAEYIAPRVTDERYAGLSRSELMTRLVSAETKLSSVSYQAFLYDRVVEENTQLKSASSLESFSRVIPARVLSRPPRTHYDTLLLDRGISSGVKENDIVALSGVALGKIISVSDASSTAELYSTAGVTQDALLGEPQAVAVLEGVGGGSFTVSLPRSVTVNVGESVRIQNSETLIVGIVTSFSGEGADSSQIVFIKSPVGMQSLDYVSIIPQSP